MPKPFDQSANKFVPEHPCPTFGICPQPDICYPQRGIIGAGLACLALKIRSESAKPIAPASVSFEAPAV
jgi:hypothetical protein